MTPAAQIIKRLVAIYGEPKTLDPDVFLAEFEKALEGHREESLHRACSEVIRTCTFWPRPAELLEHVRPTATYSHPNFTEPPVPEGYTKPTQEDRARVQALVSDLMAKLESNSHDVGNPHWSDVTRPAFEKRQAECPVPHLHRRQP